MQEQEQEQEQEARARARARIIERTRARARRVSRGVEICGDVLIVKERTTFLWGFFFSSFSALDRFNFVFFLMVYY